MVRTRLGGFMDLIRSFFIEAPNAIEIYYLVLGISLLGIILYNVLPERIALKLFIPYRIVAYRATLHKNEKKEYDWSKALNRQSILLLIVFVYSIIILLLTHLYGAIVAKVGLGILAFLFIIGAFWIDPVKN